MWREFGNTPLLSRIKAVINTPPYQLTDLLSQINAPFDEHKVIRCHSTDVFPFVTGIVFDVIHLVLADRKDECGGEHVILGIKAPKITQGERKLQCRNGYGSPQVNYLETTLQERLRFVGRKVTMDAGNSGRSSLVDVSLLDRSSIVEARDTLVGFVTANC